MELFAFYQKFADNDEGENIIILNKKKLHLAKKISEECVV